MSNHPGPEHHVDEFGVPGILRVRASGADASGVAAVGRDLGPAREVRNAAAESSVRFVDDLTPRSIRLLDGGTMAYGDEGVYVLDPAGRRPIARVTQGGRWGEATIECRRDVGRIPLLSVAVDLASLAAGWAPLHASAWVIPGEVGVLVCGWAHSGKTGALLAACANGAAPIGDDRILLSRDGSSMLGLGRPVGVKDWHVAQLHVPGAGGGAVRQVAARLGPALAGLLERSAAAGRAGAGRWARPARKGVARLRDMSSTEVDPRVLAAAGAPARLQARPDVLIVLETHPHRHVASEPADPRTVATRVAAQTRVELLPALRVQASFQYAHPGSGWGSLDQAPRKAEDILAEATRGMPAFIVRHPYPCSLAELHAEIERLAASTR